MTVADGNSKSLFTLHIRSFVTEGKYDDTGEEYFDIMLGKVGLRCFRPRLTKMENVKSMKRPYPLTMFQFITLA